MRSKLALCADVSRSAGYGGVLSQLRDFCPNAQSAARTAKCGIGIASAAETKKTAALGQRPLLGRQIDREKRAKTDLNVCHEESEPIEPAKAGARGSSGWPLAFRLGRMVDTGTSILLSAPGFGERCSIPAALLSG